jgi:hypothetical protein
VEPDYLPDLEVFVFISVIPHEDFTPWKNVLSHIIVRGVFSLRIWPLGKENARKRGLKTHHIHFIQSQGV